MPFSGFPEFNTDELTGFDNNSYSGDSSAFCEFNWGLSNVAGSSQHYTGADIRGDLNNYPDFPSPLSAPTSLYPTHGEFSNEGKLDCTSEGTSFGDSLFDRRIQFLVLPGHRRTMLLASSGDHSFPPPYLPPPRYTFAHPDLFAEL